MSLLALLPLETEAGPGATPYIIGGVALLLLFGAMIGLMSMGKGREHS